MTTAHHKAQIITTTIVIMDITITTMDTIITITIATTIITIMTITIIILAIITIKQALTLWPQTIIIFNIFHCFI